MSNQSIPCPECKSPYGYFLMEDLYACPECAFEWNPSKTIKEEDVLVVKDVNGNILQDGDTVIVIKDLKSEIGNLILNSCSSCNRNS